MMNFNNYILIKYIIKNNITTTRYFEIINQYHLLQDCVIKLKAHTFLYEYGKKKKFVLLSPYVEKIFVKFDFYAGWRSKWGARDYVRADPTARSVALVTIDGDKRVTVFFFFFFYLMKTFSAVARVVKIFN
ncbi:hypothetical protein PUN28_001553 [Cardiocondyla obscurior]|uniref:Uncharacterized protein n=1 Tax=Cardiocondyla obscurior TaxID=286306 RepID=A0AAW2H5Y5_9HYME